MIVCAKRASLTSRGSIVIIREPEIKDLPGSSLIWDLSLKRGIMLVFAFLGGVS